MAFDTTKMRGFNRVKLTITFVCTIAIVFGNCQGLVEENKTRTVGLQDPNVDATVKTALENGTVSEVVVRKDLLLFPVNAPNLVIAHTQEIHAVPQINGTDSTDGKPTAAQVAEVNEYSLSQLVNDTDNNNETAPPRFSIPVATDPDGSQNASVLEPGKLLEIISGFNLSNGVATEKVPLPDEVQNISLPKQSIVDLLSKSIPQDASITTTTTEPSSYYGIVKRSVDSDETEENSSSNSSDSNNTDESSDDADDDSSISTEVEKRSANSEDDKSDESDSNDTQEDDNASATTENNSSNSSSNSTGIEKRSLDSDEDKNDSDTKEIEDNNSSSNSTENSSTTTSSIKVAKRSVDSNEDEDDSTSNSTAYYDHMVDTIPEEEVANSTTSNLVVHKQEPISDGVDPNQMRKRKESLTDDSKESMDVAEDIVFRPLFRYRQETQLRQQYNPPRRSNSRKSYYNNYDSDYD